MKKPLLIIPLVGLWIIYLISPLAAESMRLAVENNNTAIGTVIGLSGGKATVQRGGVERELSFKDPLFPGDTVRTSLGARLRLLIQGSNVLTLRELTEVHLRMEVATPAQPKHKFTLKFLSGSGRFVVDKKKLEEGNQYDVEGGNAVATIKGSDLTVELDSNGVSSFMNGPGASALLNRMGSAEEGTDFRIGRAEDGIDLRELQKIVFNSTGIVEETKSITENHYRDVARTITPSPGGPQAPNHFGPGPTGPVVESTVSYVASETMKTVSKGVLDSIPQVVPSGLDSRPFVVTSEADLASAVVGTENVGTTLEIPTPPPVNPAPASKSVEAPITPTMNKSVIAASKPPSAPAKPSATLSTPTSTKIGSSAVISSKPAPTKK